MLFSISYEIKSNICEMFERNEMSDVYPFLVLYIVFVSSRAAGHCSSNMKQNPPELPDKIYFSSLLDGWI